MTKKRKLPSPRVLRRLLSYDPETGELRWKKRPVWLFKKPSGAKTRRWRASYWNNRYATHRAFTSKDRHGYHQGNLFNTVYRAHRLIWVLHHGTWPEADIDHINGDRSDNRIENLRSVSRMENLQNVRLRPNNTSGIVGVSWMPKLSKWQAYINVNRKRLPLGQFKNKSDAIAARKAAEKKYGFHPNHGRSK